MCFNGRPERERTRSHSHTRRTRQPDARNARVTARSRSIFPASFAVQNSIRDLGIRRWIGQPCQKHPSIKIATFDARKIKSGLPGKAAPRRQPLIRAFRRSSIKRSSVLLFPAPRTRDIRWERSATVSVSATLFLGRILCEVFSNICLYLLNIASVRRVVF